MVSGGRMKCCNSAERRHERVVSQLEKRLLDSNKYQAILKHIEYRGSNGKIKGELDVVGIRNDYRAVIFEVKGHNCTRTRKHAYDQLNRAREHFDYLRPITIYHSPEKTKRVYK